MEIVMKWIDFLRKYGPIPANDNMYDESIQRAAKRHGYKPIVFEHPFRKKVMQSLRDSLSRNIILTGTAGDGKTHLCREIWDDLGGDKQEWASDEPYLVHSYDDRQFHFIRDLSAWAPTQGQDWSNHPDKHDVFLDFCQSLFDDGEKTYIIAANDGQLVEALRKLSSNVAGELAKEAIETLLVKDRQRMEGVNVNLYNLSRGSSAEMFDLAIDALLDHPGWEECRQSDIPGLWGEFCSIRKNFGLLQTPLVRRRLRMLFELCDHSSMHLPIRQILLLLTNAVLGHSGAKDRLLRSRDVEKLCNENDLVDGCLYSNVFGSNLSERRRRGIMVFQYFKRFQIGYETTNRIDNLLIFGEDDESVADDYQTLICDDSYNSHNSKYHQAKQRYIEAVEEDDESSIFFLNQLVKQRQMLFFRIPLDKEDSYLLWDLTVFRYGGEYLNKTCSVLSQRQRLSPKITSRLIRGLNRIFTGMLFNFDDELILAESGSFTQSRVSRILKGRVSVRPRRGEMVSIELDHDSDDLLLKVSFDEEHDETLILNLVRFEFLSRVAVDGALPASFSKECYEDILAFKSRLMGEYNRIYGESECDDGYVQIRVLSCLAGKPDEKTINIRSGGK